MSESLFATVRRAFSDDLDRTFIERPDGSRIHYADLLDLTGRFARALVELGVRPGDRVAVHVEKSTEALLLYLATVRAGAVFLPLNPAYTPPEVRYFLADAEPALFVCRPEEHAAMTTLAGELGVPRSESLGVNADGTLMQHVPPSAGPDGFEDIPRTADDLAAILYTSGTTGRSKGAMLTHGNLTSNARALVETWRFSAADRLLHALPIFHAHGLFVATNVVLMSGASMLLLPHFDLDAIIRLLPRATTMMGVPTFYSRLLGRPDFDRDLVRHIRLFVSGSAPLSAETHRVFLERTGHAILERYGMTETQMNTSNPYDGARVAGSVGLPLPGVEIRIAEPKTGHLLPAGEIGVIEIRGPNVFCGYWRMPEKTAAEFRPDGFFISGDLGFIDPRGYVHIVGRDKDLIISGGFNVYPKEVEAAIQALPGVADAAVIGVPHPDFGEGVLAIVVPVPGSVPGTQLDERAMRTALAEQLANYKVPRRIVFADALPLNAMGKVQKTALRAQHRTMFASV